MRIDNGRQQYHSIGGLDGIDEADRFREAKDKTEAWIRTLGRATSAAYTVRDAIDDYVQHRRVKNSEASSRDARQRLYKHAVPALGHMRLSKVTKRDLTAWRDSLVRLSDDPEDVRKSKDGANRLLSLLKAALNLAFEKDLVGSDNSWRRVKAFEGVGEARKVFLTDAQVERLLDKTQGAFRLLCKSALLSGARYGELGGLRVEDLDARHGTLRLNGKTGPRECYLSDAALRHFTALARSKLPTAYLLTKDDGSPWGKSHQHRPMQGAVKRARLPRDTTFYALRHTHISRALLAGVNTQVVAENCGTSVRMIEKHYGKFLRADRRAMFNQVQWDKSTYS